MPVVPNNGKLYVELDRHEAVDELVSVARGLDQSRISSSMSVRRLVADIEDHLAFLAIIQPDWFRPFQDEAVTELAQVLPMGLDTAALLLRGTSDDAAEVVARRLGEAPTSWTDLTLLAGIGTDFALSRLAEHVRIHPEAEPWVNRLGVHVGAVGIAALRFTAARSAIHRASPSSEASGFIGLPLEQVTAEPSVITWHYLSFVPSLAHGLPAWPHQFLHIVSPRTYWFTLVADVDDRGRYVNVDVDDGGEPFDVGLFDCERDPPPTSFVVVRPYDGDLVVRNGHILTTPGVCGAIGGPPVGLYPNPVCHGCGVLMFHAATIESGVREYGEGFRSLFYCPDCVTVSVTGTNWN